MIKIDIKRETFWPSSTTASFFSSMTPLFSTERALTVQRTEREKARRHMLCPGPTSPDWLEGWERAGSDQSGHLTPPTCWLSSPPILVRSPSHCHPPVISFWPTVLLSPPANCLYVEWQSLIELDRAALISWRKIKAVSPLVLLQPVAVVEISLLKYQLGWPACPVGCWLPPSLPPSKRSFLYLIERQWQLRTVDRLEIKR